MQGPSGSEAGKLLAAGLPVNLTTIMAVVAAPLFLIEAQAQPVDCSQRTAEDYVSTTRTERLADYIRGLVGTQAFLHAGAIAGINQWTDRPKEWRQGSVGYERRFGEAFARNVIGTTLQDGFALGLGEDNRYFNSGEHSFRRRLGYALSSPLLARHSDGSRSISVSALGGVAGAALITQIWQPRSTAHMGYAARSFGLTFVVRAGIDVVREFTPRIVWRIVR